MGDAKRRKAMHRIIPPDVRADIAKCVRSVNVMIHGGGTCFFRLVTAIEAFKALGIPATPQFGSMLYRAGPDPEWDVVAFCSYGNAGSFTDSAYLGHAWIEVEGCLVDFTVGDWRKQHEGCITLGAEMGVDDTDKLINWTAPLLPDFFWQDAHKLMCNWRSEGEPPLGEAWYGPLTYPKGTEREMKARLTTYMEHARGLLTPAIPHMLDNIAHLRIKERLP